MRSLQYTSAPISGELLQTRHGDYCIFCRITLHRADLPHLALRASHCFERERTQCAGARFLHKGNAESTAARSTADQSVHRRESRTPGFHFVSAAASPGRTIARVLSDGQQHARRRILPSSLRSSTAGKWRRSVRLVRRVAGRGLPEGNPCSISRSRIARNRRRTLTAMSGALVAIRRSLGAANAGVITTSSSRSTQRQEARAAKRGGERLAVQAIAELLRKDTARRQVQAIAVCKPIWPLARISPPYHFVTE